MATYILVHGAWSGGWGYKPIARALRAAGHEVYVPTLTGLGEREHLASGAIDLTLHITDVVNMIDYEDLSDVILCGHSYGGMVITGVAAAVGDRIRTLFYLDAFLPKDGEALWDIADDFARRHYIDAQRDTPGLVAPLRLPGAEGPGRAPQQPPLADPDRAGPLHRQGNRGKEPHLRLRHPRHPDRLHQILRRGPAGQRLDGAGDRHGPSGRRGRP